MGMGTMGMGTESLEWDGMDTRKSFPHISTVHGKCALSHNNSDAEGQSSRSYEAKDICGGLAKASFSTQGVE